MTICHHYIRARGQVLPFASMQRIEEKPLHYSYRFYFLTGKLYCNSGVLTGKLYCHRTDIVSKHAVVLPDGTLFGEDVKTKIKKLLLEECNLHTLVRLPNSVFAPYTSIKTNILFFEKKAAGPSSNKKSATKDVWYYEVPLPKGVKAFT